jgi:hypothetical protein
LAMPINGSSRSSSVRPSAFRSALCGARASPLVISLLLSAICLVNAFEAINRDALAA